ncbi:MAG: hypothetical protein C4B58_14715 [Deltaproteobacteria bacterium]|nr:MAG: hypothetical protein C4B58_14715 [Deltaproteobacteria bacterium]
MGVSRHQYYIQKFCFFLYEEVDKEVKQKDIAEIKEPTAKVYSASYMARHNLGSTGGIQQGLNTLSKKDLIEKDYRTGVWSVVDPIFVCWLIEMSL